MTTPLKLIREVKHYIYKRTAVLWLVRGQVPSNHISLYLKVLTTVGLSSKSWIGISWRTCPTNSKNRSCQAIKDIKVELAFRSSEFTGWRKMTFEFHWWWSISKIVQLRSNHSHRVHKTVERNWIPKCRLSAILLIIAKRAESACTAQRITPKKNALASKPIRWLPSVA